MGLGKYVPATSAEQLAMLQSMGMNKLDDLYVNVPQDLKLKELNIPEGKSELEVRRELVKMAEKNVQFASIFRGAGAYNHYIPALVKQISAKEEFLTAYTPYQAEISQGILQSIFEFQTMICELTGMDASNASVYDGASAASEAVHMTVDRKRKKALISGAADPMTIQTIKTYSGGSGVEIEIIPTKDGVTDHDKLKEMLTKDVAAVFVQQPNYFGQIEDTEAVAELVHENKSKFILGVSPVASVVMKTPRAVGADIVTGDAQPFGLPLSFGGPFLGFMATTSKLIRQLPGRIVGQTTDLNGDRAFVLTLQAREQHIRREKAASNICSNQAHCALVASIYMTTMGPTGVTDVANQCYSKAHYLANELGKISGFELEYPGEFFHEFVTKSPIEPNELMAKLEEHGILGGYPLGDKILWCVTEMNTKERMDELITIIKEVTA